MIEQLEAHAPYVAFIAGMAVLGLVLVVETIREARNQRSTR